MRPTVAVVSRATGRDTRVPFAVLKQCPAVITHRGAMSAPEQELSRRPPPAVGSPVIVSLTAKPYLPLMTSCPPAMACAGVAVPVASPATAERQEQQHRDEAGEQKRGPHVERRRAVTYEYE
nr:hypothetical protein GCM10020092_059390 [Actinoplanes digitatis]